MWGNLSMTLPSSSFVEDESLHLHCTGKPCPFPRTQATLKHPEKQMAFKHWFITPAPSRRLPAGVRYFLAWGHFCWFLSFPAKPKKHCCLLLKLFWSPRPQCWRSALPFGTSPSRSWAGVSICSSRKTLYSHLPLWPLITQSGQQKALSQSKGNLHGSEKSFCMSSRVGPKREVTSGLFSLISKSHSTS